MLIENYRRIAKPSYDSDGGYPSAAEIGLRGLTYNRYGNGSGDDGLFRRWVFNARDRERSSEWGDVRDIVLARASAPAVATTGFPSVLMLYPYELLMDTGVSHNNLFNLSAITVVLPSGRWVQLKQKGMYSMCGGLEIEVFYLDHCPCAEVTLEGPQRHGTSFIRTQYREVQRDSQGYEIEADDWCPDCEDYYDECGCEPPEVEEPAVHIKTGGAYGFIRVDFLVPPRKVIDTPEERGWVLSLIGKFLEDISSEAREIHGAAVHSTGYIRRHIGRDSYVFSNQHAMAEDMLRDHITGWEYDCQAPINTRILGEVFSKENAILRLTASVSRHSGVYWKIFRSTIGHSSSPIRAEEEMPRDLTTEELNERVRDVLVVRTLAELRRGRSRSPDPIHVTDNTLYRVGCGGACTGWAISAVNEDPLRIERLLNRQGIPTKVVPWPESNNPNERMHPIIGMSVAVPFEQEEDHVVTFS